MMQEIRAGSGDRRVVVLGYFVLPTQALFEGCPASWCIATDVYNKDGRFARAPGRGGVDTTGTSIADIQLRVGSFEVAALVLVGYSAGCQAVRELLRAGAEPEAVLALDGTSGSLPPTVAQLFPWQDAAERARQGKQILVLTHTQQTYTEHRGQDSFLSTLEGVRLITGWEPGKPLGDVPLMRRDGDLVVASYASAQIDPEAHRRQQTVALPDLLRRIVVPWVEARAGHGAVETSPLPSTSRYGSPRPLLQLGSRGSEVSAWQAALSSAGWLLTVDGLFGPATRIATKLLQQQSGLAADGIVGPATREALKALHGDGEPPTALHALSEAEKDRIFGRIEWELAEPPQGQIRIVSGSDLVWVHLPQIAGLLGAPRDESVLMHRLAGPRLMELFEAWGKTGVLARVIAWSGSFAPRLVRGGTALSSHARGIAFDLNAQWLPRGEPMPPLGVMGSLAELVPIAEERGWVNGGAWAMPDPMHFELARVIG